MNTPIRRTAAVRASHGAAATGCVALVCAACVYLALDPATTARANLDACVHERLAPRGEVAGAAGSAASAALARPADRADRNQVFSAALYACSTQP